MDTTENGPENLLGAEINFQMKYRPDFELFGESHSRIIISIESNNISIIKKLAKKHKINFIILGKVIKDYLRVNDFIDIEVGEIYSGWYSSIAGKM